MIIFFNILITVIIVIGLVFLTIAALGFMRLPDLFCRLHVTSIIDTLGAPLLLLAIAIYLLTQINYGAFAFSDILPSGKLLLSIFILFFTSPLVGHFLSRAAIESGYGAEMVQGLSDEQEENKTETVISETTSILDEQIVVDKLIDALQDSTPGNIPAINDDDTVDEVIEQIKKAKENSQEDKA